ncbi:MAG TPA: oligosaccharide flippase family protein [Chitinophagaceae bacterium]|nr:oligosaccharide flippase family protein [Chitinophagaceae bacterium]
MVTSRLLKKTLLFTVLGFIPVASQLILAPLFTRYLSKYEYGVITLCNIFASYAGILIGLGFDSAFSIFYFHFSRKPKWLNKLISTVILSILGFTLLALLIFLIGGDHLFAYFGADDYFTFTRFGIPVLFTTLTSVVVSVLQSYFRNSENLKLYSIVSVGVFVFAVTGQLIGLIAYNAGAGGIVNGRMIGALLATLIILIYIFSNFKLQFNFNLFKKCLAYGYPMAAYGLIGVAFDNIDKLSIERFFGKDALGIYGVAFLVASVLELIRTSFVITINPDVYRNIEDKSPGALNKISSSIRFFCVSSVIGMCLLLAISWPVFTIFINSKFHNALLFLPLLFLGVLPKIYYTYFAMPLFYFKRTKALAIVNLIALAAGWLYVEIVKGSLGVFGLCAVVFVVKIIQCLGVYFYSRKYEMKVRFGFSLLGKDGVIIWIAALCLAVAVCLMLLYPAYIMYINCIPLVAVFYAAFLFLKRRKPALFRRA